MKIAYLFDTFPSATETFLAREINALRARGLAIEVWALNAGEGIYQIPLLPRALKLRGADYFWRATGEKLAPELQRANISHVHGAWANHVADIARAAAQNTGFAVEFRRARPRFVGERRRFKSEIKFGEMGDGLHARGRNRIRKIRR